MSDENFFSNRHVFSFRKQSTADRRDGKNDEDTRIGRLRQRRGRSIVHRSLEDNYGAVIVANHEALAQFLERVSPIVGDREKGNGF